MKKTIMFTIFVLILLAFISVNLFRQNSYSKLETAKSNDTWWEVQSIDTVKYSRDIAREKANSTSFDETIDRQVFLIAQTGVTHIAIGTPYDSEFLPFLKRWVTASRKYDLKVWFRGNLSGWEGWFGYKKISRDDHIKMIQDFITSNGKVFENGDIFSPCTECENGGPGDPRSTGDLKGHREFLIEEYQVVNDSFRKIGKNVRSYFPMNGDVARSVMDKETTKALGGVVVIDHYVKTPDKLATDIRSISLKSGGKVILAEIGAPIPDIHGKFDEGEQADWVSDSLTTLAEIPQLIGLNYWTSFGGSTSLWGEEYKARQVVAVLEKFYRPKVLRGRIVNLLGKPIEGVKIAVGVKTTFTDRDGLFTIAYLNSEENFQIEAKGYKYYEGKVAEVIQNNKIVLSKEKEDIFFRIQKFLYLTL